MSDTPANANEGCVGPESAQAGKASACEGCPNQKKCASGEAAKPDPALDLIATRLESVKHIVLVLSGKGGVGKSTCSAQLAFALAKAGKSVGLLDIDICGPSIPLMLGLKGHTVHESATGWSPVYVTQEGLRGDAAASADDDDDDDVEIGVMSIGFMMPDDDAAVIWRGPRKNGLIKQFLTDVEWGEIDYLLIDTPPGTSDEHISIVQYLAKALRPTDGAVVVTTSQEVSMMDVRKELNFCKKTKLPVLGVIENMATYTVPLQSLRFVLPSGEDITARLEAALAQAAPDLLQCGAQLSVFPTTGGGPRGMAASFGVPFLGTLPFDPNITRSCEAGVSFSARFGDSDAARALSSIVQQLLACHSEAAPMQE